MKKMKTILGVMLALAVLMSCVFPISASAEEDLRFSEEYENFLIDRINEFPGFHAEKCTLDGYPDIRVEADSGRVFFFEVKVQRRSFMSVKNALPDADLVPSETIALNLSDLQRYFKLQKKEDKPFFIIWGLLERPCIVPEGKTQFYIQSLPELERIYRQYGDTRRFRRESGKGDVVNGQHKGVVVNYHFSLNELEPLDLKALLPTLA